MKQDTKMNILYIGCFRLPRYDAAAARVLNNARAFKACGHDITFISWGGRYDMQHLCSDGKYRIDGMEYIITGELDPKGAIVSKMIQLFLRGEKTLAILNSMQQKPDLIIIYNADNSWTKTMISFCSEHKIKLANDITEWYDSNDLHFWGIPSYNINMTKTQRLVKNKIVISSYLNSYYRESNNLQLPPLCDSQEEKWGAIVEDKRIVPFDGITLIYAGNPAKKDCVHTVINAVNTLANEGQHIRFIIIGVTRESYFKNYQHMLMTKNLHDNILFLGRVSQDLIPAYYKKADFMVLLREPSRKNMAGFPTKFAESMIAGIPVIANVTSDLGLYIRDGENGFVVSGYKYDDILFTLRDKLSFLSAKNIAQMKELTKSMNREFDYRTHKDAIESFLGKIR